MYRKNEVEPWNRLYWIYCLNTDISGFSSSSCWGLSGLPLPDEIMMTFIGYLTSIGQLNLVFTFLSAVTGSICGITVSYYLGGRLGYPFLKRYGSKFFITPNG